MIWSRCIVIKKLWIIFFVGQTKERERGWFPRVCAKQDVSNGHYSGSEMVADHEKAQ